MRDRLAVGLADELDARALELGTQRCEILDDAVVHNGDAAGGVGVRVGVAVIRRAVGGPAGMPHAGAARERAGRQFAGNELVEVLDAAGLLGDLQLTVADDRDAGGVVAAVFQASQALDDHIQGGAGSDVSDDAAHGFQGTGDSSPGRLAATAWARSSASPTRW